MFNIPDVDDREPLQSNDEFGPCPNLYDISQDKLTVKGAMYLYGGIKLGVNLWDHEPSINEIRIALARAILGDIPGETSKASIIQCLDILGGSHISKALSDLPVSEIFGGECSINIKGFDGFRVEIRIARNSLGSVNVGCGPNSLNLRSFAIYENLNGSYEVECSRHEVVFAKYNLDREHIDDLGKVIEDDRISDIIRDIKAIIDGRLISSFM